MTTTTLRNGLQELEVLLMQPPSSITRPLQETDIVPCQEWAIDKASRINQVISRYLTPKKEISRKAMKKRRQSMYKQFSEWAHKVDADLDHRYTMDHLERVVAYVELLAELHIVENQKDYPNYKPKIFSHDAAKASRLHDVGKVCVDPALLQSQARYERNSPPRQILQIHTVCGGIILNIPGYENGKDTRIPLAQRIAKWHHYPEYGEETCLAAMITGIADNLDAGTSERSYKKALPFDQVVEEWLIPKYARNVTCAPVLGTFLKHLELFRGLCEQLHQETASPTMLLNI